MEHTIERLFYNEGEYGEDSDILHKLRGPAIKKLVEHYGPPACEKCNESFGVLGTTKALYFEMTYMECRFCEEPFELSKYLRAISQ